MRNDRVLVILLALLTCTSCGGGGGAHGGGITGSGLVIGPITGFGSVIVQDIEFDVSTADITIEGIPAGENDLRLGMVVTVSGEIDEPAATGVAMSVDYDNELRGPVDMVDAGSGTIVVLGQLVLVDAQTVFDGTSLATLMPGDIVEVSGFFDSYHNLHATRVELEEPNDEIELRGTISELDTVAQTFQLGPQPVDYSSAEIENEPPGGLIDGLPVEVETHQPLVDGVLIADEVEVRSEGFEGEEGEDVEIEGFVTDVLSSDEFIMSGARRVRTTPDTRYDNGGPGDIVVNARLHVRGVLDAQNVLIAEQIEFED